MSGVALCGMCRWFYITMLAWLLSQILCSVCVQPERWPCRILNQSGGFSWGSDEERPMRGEDPDMFLGFGGSDSGYDKFFRYRFWYHQKKRKIPGSHYTFSKFQNFGDKNQFRYWFRDFFFGTKFFRYWFRDFFLVPIFPIPAKQLLERYWISTFCKAWNRCGKKRCRNCCWVSFNPHQHYL